jgi:hypothetical protein
MTDLPTIEVIVGGHEASDVERAMGTLPEPITKNDFYVRKMKDLLKAMVNLHPLDERSGGFITMFQSRCARCP